MDFLFEALALGENFEFVKNDAFLTPSIPVIPVWPGLKLCLSLTGFPAPCLPPKVNWLCIVRYAIGSKESLRCWFPIDVLAFCD